MNAKEIIYFHTFHTISDLKKVYFSKKKEHVPHVSFDLYHANNQNINEIFQSKGMMATIYPHTCYQVYTHTSNADE